MSQELGTGGSDMKIVLQHGWAMSASLWHDWLNPLAQAFPESTVIVPDRGYFGTNGSDWNCIEQLETQSTDSTMIVCHSLGLHLVPMAVLGQCTRLIVISGFRKFHEGTERDARRSRLVIQRMLSKANNNLNEVLDEFYRNCGLKVSPGINLTAMGADRLREDLSLLDKCDLSLNLLAVPSILILHGTDDMIVSSDKADLLHNRLPNSRLTKLAAAEHALPFTHTQWCIEQIVKSFAPHEGVLANAR